MFRHAFSALAAVLLTASVSSAQAKPSDPAPLHKRVEAAQIALRNVLDPSGEEGKSEETSSKLAQHWRHHRRHWNDWDDWHDHWRNHHHRHHW